MKEKGRFNAFVRYKDVSIVLLTAALVAIFAVSNSQFLSQENLFVMLKTMPELGLIAIGMTMLIIAGEFDLSVGSTFALSPFIMAWLTEAAGVNPLLAFLIGIASGVAVGFVNGIITTKIGIPSFITTLGTMMAFRGVVLLASSGFPEAYDRSRPVARFFTSDVSGFPVQVFWFIAAAIVIWVLLENHRFGNWTYVTGGNRSASVAMGISVDRVKIINFMIVAGLAALAGMSQYLRLESAQPDSGTSLELDTIAASVIGGTALAGGAGSVIGSVIGSVLIRIMDNGLVLAGAPSYWFRVFVGLLLVVAVAFHRLVERTIDRVR